MIKLAKPYIPERAYDLVKKVLESGNLIQGQYVTEFEQLVQTYLSVPYAKMVTSGTAALHLAMLALDIQQGDEVIVPAFTYPATANAVELVGAKPVMVDINFTDFCIDTSKIEAKITSKTRAIMPVHEFGQAAKMDDIIAIARKHKLKIVEDAACALGTDYEGEMAGTFGDFGCFSLHPRKAITTGEGGIVVTHDKKLARKIDLLRNHGAEKRDGKLDFCLPGLNYRMTDFQAAMGIPQLEEMEQIIDIRQQQAQEYNALLEAIDWVQTPMIFPERKHVYQTYHVLIRNRNRDELIQLLREKGVETNLGAQALHCLTFFAEKYGYQPGDFPNARDAYNQGLALPLGSHLNNGDIEKVVDLIKMIH
ncbi:UDP-4-amino-4-deoxy-L-arabinose--oxoglutarate aminotransferase [Salinivirga cyanobacteriivorans]|uniref:UDP-4-amino-4-deoxy-L-arabinose--oxoglutarate aminotransferase n=1 Tax=Salinivirga cyanobacteriivorans TaxID=1307839 RepID=A0A0S2I0E6_9BACT|nr:DegT/DnrJ/EryC1/StrS family aminotransferase [Salinivirga cyanobacteriivorans]ALO15760.1 UDP-4-amino-4-deoxy-L-arabinose--oxoglutarate aminotransferase [Salinivirga cyanobacteriivorans]